MANQPSKPPAQTAGNTYRKAVFIIAFSILFLESLILITSTVWGNYAPQWAEPILDKKGPLLGVAAAVALLLSLLWAWNPTGLAMYATLASGVLSFAAATYNLELELDDLPLGLAMLGLAWPLYVTMLPNLRWPESKADWCTLVAPVLFIALTAMSIMLGIKPVTEVVVIAGILGTGGIVLAALAAGVLFTCGIIIVQLMVQLAVHFVRRRSRPYWSWRRISQSPRRSRTERRRQQRRRR